jgi:hypothetical protein
MATHLEEEQATQPAGIVEQPVRDDVERKRFLKIAGTAGAASFGAFVLAANSHPAPRCEVGSTRRDLIPAGGSTPYQRLTPNTQRPDVNGTLTERDDRHARS